jgi:hypothetical protein
VDVGRRALSSACAAFYLTLSACSASFPNRTNDMTLTFMNNPGEDPALRQPK